MATWSGVIDNVFIGSIAWFLNKNWVQKLMRGLGSSQGSVKVRRMANPTVGSSCSDSHDEFAFQFTVGLSGQREKAHGEKGIHRGYRGSDSRLRPFTSDPIPKMNFFEEAPAFAVEVRSEQDYGAAAEETLPISEPAALRPELWLYGMWIY